MSEFTTYTDISSIIKFRYNLYKVHKNACIDVIPYIVKLGIHYIESNNHFNHVNM